MKNKGTRLVLCEASGPLKTLLDNLSGEEGGLWLIALKRMLRKESPFEREWKVWKTIQTEIYSSIDTLYDAIEKREGSPVTRRDGLKTKVSETLYLVTVTLEGLGFSHGANLSAVYKQASLLGLSLCPDDLPWQLRLVYVDQPKGEKLFIATTTFPAGPCNNPCIAYLGAMDFRGIGPADTINMGTRGDSFHPTDKFVFCFQKKN